MKKNRFFVKRFISLLVLVAMMISFVPFSIKAESAQDNHYDRVVDSSTMHNWKKYFDLNNLDTSNAGGVWTDKSVFTDASAFPDSVTMLDSNKNFLTALSAIAANKEIVGYSTVPTDTVFVLDLSGSMSSSNVTQLVNATNAAIKKLQDTNQNNRVGVVLYSGSSNDRSYNNAVASLMPIDRYTTGNDGSYVVYNNGRVYLDNDVRGTNGSVVSESKTHSGATYIQAGLWAAYELFDAIADSDIVIGENNWQTGDYRMPIVVLMSDGAPTLGTNNFANVAAQNANFGYGNDNVMTAGQGFLVQLTASYIKNRIENKYKINAEGGAGRSLFYTLGFNLDSISNSTAKNVAKSVMNPQNSTVTDQLWATYNATNYSMQVSVANSRGGYSNVSVSKNAYATDKNYVDEYFSASGNGLTDAFNDIVDEIILQSRYYPTHLEGGNPDFSGYVEFTDTLGEHMEVKHINGILLGDVLYDGHMMASKLADTTAGGLGTPENPTELGDEFIRAVRMRLGISVSDAQAIVAKAYADGQLRYNDENDWSNYIAWYAKADGTYAGFYDEDGTEQVPAGAVYINRSYGFLGATTGSIKNSDMMYMSVQVSTNIETGKQTVIWRIPAALVPMITYNVTLKGTNIDAATDITISVENADSVAPIRLIYETGLQSDLNPFNITSITGGVIGANPKTDEDHIADDGHTRVFWNNSFDISAASHDNHITALAEFTPNKENERFYYTFDSAVFKKSDSSYVLVGQNETLNENGEYYHRRYVFKSTSSKPVFEYEKMSKASINATTWKDDFQTLDGSVTGAWVVPKGTPARELDMYSEHKSVNATNSASMVFYPYMDEQNNVVYVEMNLGNNGLLSVTPETGIKISKTVDKFETGTSDTFKFQITTSVAGSFETWITDLDDTPVGAGTTVNFVNGVYEFTLKKDQTLWISGVPAGTTYVVQEFADNPDYKVKSVHVNSVATGSYATGTVSQYIIDDVDFVNTAIGEGNLFITKQVVDVNGNAVDVNDAVKFTAEISLMDRNGNPVSGTFDSTVGRITFQNGKYTAILTDGVSLVIRGIPEMTQFSVTETNIPAGFALDNNKSVLTGVIDTATNDEARIVNTYDPVAVSGQGVNVQVTKQISGNRSQWLAGESYTFNLERLSAAGGTVIATATIDSNNAAKTHLFTLTGENYAEAGNYYYRIREVVGTQGGITYDAADRRFCVTVDDSDMDGDLEIVSVTNEVNTTVSGNWQVSANFNNVYAPTGSATATINIQKQINDNHSLSGYQFVLYDADPAVVADAAEIVKSALTDSTGKAAVQLAFSAEDAGNTYTYYLAELNRGATINNVKYSTAVYKVTISVTDNLDGTISTQTEIDGLPSGMTVPTFINEYIPSASDYVTISGKKVIDGDRVLNAEEFAFQIEAVTAGAPMPAQTVVKNAADGSFQFPAIEYVHVPVNSSVTTYVYKITEIADKKIGGFTHYDDTVYTVTVTVTDNGTVITATPIISNGTANVSDIVFTNVYDAADANVTLTGTKLLTGKKLQGGDFEFVLTRVTANAPMPLNDAQSNSTTNDANGNINFGTITFNKKGVYVYTITETKLSDDRYECDASVYTLTVTVTDNAQGVLSAKTELTKDGMASKEIVFRNGYIPKPISHDLHAKFGVQGVKVLEGRAMEDGEFTFALINAVNGTQVGETVTNDANGKFKFPEVQITMPGFHHYKIIEVAGDLNGVTYDTTALHIRLEVVQSDDGVLSVVDEQLHKGVVTKQEVGGVLTEVTTYENITANGTITFTNTYKAESAYVALEATKTLSGRKLRDGEFKFDLHKTGANYAYDATTLVQDDVVLKLQDNGTGKIIFAEEKFDAAGTYYFAVVEDEKDEKGVTADRTVHKVEVTVTDDLNGKLVATLKINGQQINGSTADMVKFQNTYAAAATQIKIGGTKVLNGRELQAEEFSFELYDANNKHIETVKNAADGTFNFKAIPVDKAGEYTFTVCELQGAAEGVTYDAARYTVKVKVTDNLDGTFKVEYSYLNGSATVDGVSFTNVYTAPVPPTSNPQTGDTMRPVLLIAILLVSAFGFGTTMFLAYKKKEQ